MRAGLVAALVASAMPALGQESGRASATGSDSLTLNGHAYRLFGIDGLGFNQSCFVDARPLACGASAVRALQTLLDPGAVTCTPTGNSAAGATLAKCTVADGDVALRLVEQGWAVADRAVSTDYAAAEEAARSGKVGAWSGTFLPPKAYHAQIAAVEAQYAALAGETARAEVDAALAAGKLDLRGLTGIELEVADAGADSAALGGHGIRYGEFKPGFIDAAIEPPAIFDWTKVAGVLEATRKQGVETIETGIADVIWSELTARPAQTIDTRNADTFYAALQSQSADWIAAKRQPVLFVMAPSLPGWVRDWFAGQPPDGAEVSRREDRTSPSYLGTIDGVDVYVGPGRERAALLVPSDILDSMTFGKDDSGHVLTLQVDAAQNEWLLHYGMGLRWRDDTLTWLSFPQMAAPTPDAG